MDYIHGMYIQTGILIDNYDFPDFVSHVTYYTDTGYVHPRMGFIFPFGKTKAHKLTSMLGVKYDIYGDDFYYTTAQLDMNLNFKKIEFIAKNEYTRGVDNNLDSFEYKYSVLYKYKRTIKIGPHVESYIHVMQDPEIPIERMHLGMGPFISIVYEEYYVYFLIFMGIDVDNDNKFISKYTALYSF